ncbi:MAG TPA: CopD family protein [Gemmatimonadaceae bacterium]|nr:CopD family protein [Gemmatimonadaceae bacterium]
MQGEPLLDWVDPVREYVGFVGQFLALGAVGFRFAAVRGRATDAVDLGERAVFDDALRRTAIIGTVAFAVQIALFLAGLPASAARAHMTTERLLTSNLQTGSAAALFALGFIGLVLASFRVRAGWFLAMIGVVLAPLTAVVTGKWSGLVNPLHRVAAGLWIGTLFVLVVAGLSTILLEERTRDRRGAMAADLVNSFSPLALTCGVFVVASGLTTAYSHLQPLSSLWTTPYGYTLIVKLVLVACVFALGAWNWRRMRPRLGTEDAAHAVRRSARAELATAALVLVATAILISLPSPREYLQRTAPAVGAPGMTTSTPHP